VIDNCKQCGRAFVAGESPTCPDCGAIVDQQLQAAQRPPSREAMRPVSKATLFLIAANVVMFLLMALTSGSLMNFDIPTSIKWGANYGPLTLTGQWWRLETSTFLHGGLFHVLFNMWALLNLGLLAEIIFGTEQYLALYLLAGLGGSVASLCWHPTVVGVGASGAIFGVAGAMLPALFFERNQRLRAAMRGNLGSIAFFVVFNILYGAGARQIDNAAHLGGLATGLLLGLALPKVSEGPLSRSRGRTLAALLATAALIFAGAMYAKRSGSATITYSRARDAALANKVDEAITLAKQAVAQKPELTEAHLLLASLYLDSRQPELAIPELRIVTQQAPNFPDGFSLLCRATVSARAHSDSLQACRKAVTLNPKSADDNYFLGIALMQNADYQPAATQFQRVLQLDPNYEGATEALEESQRLATK
jgi:membrane associated rhomboid family serine protease